GPPVWFSAFTGREKGTYCLFENTIRCKAGISNSIGPLRGRIAWLKPPSSHSPGIFSTREINRFLGNAGADAWFLFRPAQSVVRLPSPRTDSEGSRRGKAGG